MIVSAFIVFLVLIVSTILYCKYTKKFHYGTSFFTIVVGVSYTCLYWLCLSYCQIRAKLIKSINYFSLFLLLHFRASWRLYFRILLLLGLDSYQSLLICQFSLFLWWSHILCVCLCILRKSCQTTWNLSSIPCVFFDSP